MMKFMPPNTKLQKKWNLVQQKNVSAVDEPENRSRTLCGSCVCVYEYCFCAQKLGGLKEVSHILKHFNDAMI